MEEEGEATWPCNEELVVGGALALALSSSCSS